MSFKLILFTGHRNRIADPVDLATIFHEFPDAIPMHGGAEGFDHQVDDFYRRREVLPEVFKPRYRLFPQGQGKRAPIHRNEEILRYLVPSRDLVVALYDGRTSGGTYRTVEAARIAHVEVRILKPKG